MYTTAVQDMKFVKLFGLKPSYNLIPDKANANAKITHISGKKL